MDAIGEPHPLQINDKSLPFGIVLVAVVACVDVFQDSPQLQAKAAILVPKNVPSKQRCLGKVIDKQFLAKWQGLKAWHFIAQQLQVSKALA